MLEQEYIDESDIDSLTFPGQESDEPEDIPEVLEDAPGGEEIKNPKYYVDNKMLVAALKDWVERVNLAKAEGKDRPQIPEFVGKSILDIATNMANKFNFRRYSYKDEMISDACLNVLTYLHNFKVDAPTRSGTPNAFWYISRQCHNSFTKRIQSEHRQQYYKAKSFEMLASSTDLLGEEDLDGQHESGNQSIQEMYNDLFAKAKAYEEKYAKKNAKTDESSDEDDVGTQSPVGVLAEFME